MSRGFSGVRRGLRGARARALRGVRRSGPGNHRAGHRIGAALSPPGDHPIPDRARDRRGGHGRAGRLPHLQHPPRRRAPGRRGSADRVRSSASRLWILLAVFALGWFCNLGYRHLIKPDEGRYAEIPREMVVSGDWLTPRLNGYKYFEKPALQYWITAAAFTAFGQNEGAARLWPGLTGFLGVLLVFWAGKRLFAPPAGLYGAAVASSCALYVAIGHVLTLDMALTFFLSASVFAFAVAQQDSGESERRRWMLVAWAAAALAVMTKGLIGIVLPAGAVALYVLIERDWKLLGRLHVLCGGLLFLPIAAPWFIAVSLANPEFLRFFCLR